MSISAFTSSRLQIVDDQRIERYNVKDEAAVIFVAVYVGDHFLSRPNLTDASDKALIQTFLGPATVSGIEQYRKHYPLEMPEPDISPSASKEKKEAYTSIEQRYELTLDKMRALRQFFIQSPFVIAHDNYLLCRPITITIENARSDFVNDERMAAIRMRICQGKIKIIAISNYCMQNLDRMIAKHSAVSTSYFVARNLTQYSPSL